MTRRFLAAVALTVACAAPLAAHTFEVTDVELSFGAGRYRVDVTVDVDALALGVSPSTDSAEVVAALRALSPEERERAEERARGALLRRVRVWFDDERVEPEVSFPAPGEEFRGVPSVFGIRARFEGAIPREAAAVRLALGRALGAVRLAFDPPAGEPSVFLLAAGEGSPSFDLAGSHVPSVAATVSRYARLGFLHIVPRGVDHILFVLGLFLFGHSWRPLLIQVSAFTVAHTLTLGLAAAGVVSLPSRVVEPLIAISIVWIAVENLFAERLTVRRTAIVFGFGLLHGLGFAGVLGELGLPEGRFLVSLASFNVGVEAGQLAVVLAASLLLFPLRRREDWFRVVVVPVSLAIGAVGLFWAIERVLP